MNPRILVFAGSIRRDSLNRMLALEAAGALVGLGMDVTWADLRDYPMPLYDGDLEAGGAPEAVKSFQNLVRAYDAFVIASPEYNGSFSALLKNAIDWASRPQSGEKHTAAFRGKTAAILSASPGPGGGRRGLRHLRELLEMLGVTVTPASVVIPHANRAFDSEGRLVRAEDRRAVAQLALELATAIKPSVAAV